MTNYERIKDMSVEEFAEEFSERNDCAFCKLDIGQSCETTGCKQGYIQYLESEVQENEKCNEDYC